MDRTSAQRTHDRLVAAAVAVVDGVAAAVVVVVAVAEAELVETGSGNRASLDPNWSEDSKSWGQIGPEKTSSSGWPSF